MLMMGRRIIENPIAKDKGQGLLGLEAQSHMRRGVSMR